MAKDLNSYDSPTNPFGQQLKQATESGNNGRTPVNPDAADNRPDISVETRVNKGSSTGFTPASA